MQILPPIKSTLCNIRIISILKRNKKLRTNISLVFSIMCNTAYVSSNIVFGVIYKCAWFLAMALFYSLLIVIGYIILRADEQILRFPTTVRRFCFLSGVLLIFADILISAVMLFTAFGGGFSAVNKVLVGELVFYSVFNFLRLIYSVVQCKRNSELVRHAIYTVRAVSALITLFNFLVTVIHPGANGRTFQVVLTIGVSLTVFLLAVVLIYRSKRENDLI